MSNPRIASLGILFCLVLTSTRLQAQLKPQDVPGFELRARVVSIGGEMPTQQKFTFCFAVGGGEMVSENGGWSDWLAFGGEQLEKTLKGY